MVSLWDFKDSTKPTEIAIESAINTKPLSVESYLRSTKVSIEDKLNIIKVNVEKILGVYKENTITIKNIEDFHNYISDSIDNGIIAIDTETNNSLDPISCKIMGLCIYTPNHKNAYIPVNHTDLQGNKYTWQITEDQIKEELSRLTNTKIIMHNGKFDYEVIKCTCGIALNVYWDTMIGARLLNENEKAGLKLQYISKIDPSIEKYSIEHLFEKISYAIVEPELFALYAATDAYMTYKLYEYQVDEFNKFENSKLKSLLLDIEMPILTISAEMELTGVSLDIEYCNRLKNKYYADLDIVNSKINNELNKYADIISKWRLTAKAQEKPLSEKPNKDGKYLPQKSLSEKLENPPALTSTTQLSILLYDILGVKPVDKKNPRGTGAEILEKIDLPLCKLLLEQRQLLKVITAFIDALPAKINIDGRLHSHFNQLGTDTGRFSSTDPNLQQIPSKNKDIRKMFVASPGYTFVSADFSAQEPRLLTAYSRDKNMIEGFYNNRDPYATIGVGVYKNSYWDNMEHFEDGSPNIDGKKRRKKMKLLLLGMMYGMGPGLLATTMGCSKEEAEKIIEDFYKGFPDIQSWIKKTEEDAKINGYVEDFWGRRRRLPDIQLPPIEVKFSKINNNQNFNPLLYTSGVNQDSNKIKYYQEQATKIRNKNDFAALQKLADKDGIYIKDNNGFISQAQRQCVNSRVQGGAATMTKKAMIAISRDKEINDMGFKLLIGVHDELIGECPIEYAEACGERLSYLMTSCVPELNMVFKSDVEIEKHWYDNEYNKEIRKEYKALLESNEVDKALELLYNNHIESTHEYLSEVINCEE